MKKIQPRKSSCRQVGFAFLPATLFFRMAAMFRPSDLFDLAQTDHPGLFDGVTHAWEALQRIGAYLEKKIAASRAGTPSSIQQSHPGAIIGPDVLIGDGSEVEPGAMIKGPALIGRNCRIRHNAYIRENVIIGNDCVVGNASELKNAWMFNGAQAPHYNYIGDSILGFGAHLGAGVKISNLRLLPGNVLVVSGKMKWDTGLRKMGALVGDRAEVGCNAVLNPGSILGRGSLVYPNVFWRGVLPANGIAKNKAEVLVASRQSSSS